MLAVEQPDWQEVMSYITTIYKHFEVDGKVDATTAWHGFLAERNNGAMSLNQDFPNWGISNLLVNKLGFI